MRRKKHTFYATDEEFRIIEVYAEQANSSFSEYVRKSALAEGKRHLPQKRFKSLVGQLIQEALNERFPVQEAAHAAIKHEVRDMGEG